MRLVLSVAVLILGQSLAFCQANTFTVSANQHYWLKNGLPFLTIGYNRYNVWNPSDPANDGLSIDAYVARISQYGGNVIRVWAEQADQNPTGDYYLEYPAGTYNENQAARLDALFTAADKYGVYVEICPWDTYGIKNSFSAFAYNAANGGPITSYSQMISSQAARGYLKNKISYMYNRWGMHPSFFLWTFNEIDALDSSNTDQMNFAQDIGSYIRSIDPYHPFTISYTGSGAGYPPLEKLSQIGAADIHFYGAITGTAAVPKENETATTRDGGYMNFGKPLVLSEWGVARKANTDDLVNAVMWGGIGIGTSGTGMVWTDRYTYGSFTPAQLAIMQNLSTFIGKLDWPNLTSNHHASSTEVTSSSRGVTPYASLDQTHAIVLLVAGSVGSSTATTVTINGLAPSHLFNIEIWSTYAGTRTSTGTITGTSSLTLSSSSSGSLVFATPSVPTMQALYIH